MDYMDKLSDITVTPIPLTSNAINKVAQGSNNNNASLPFQMPTSNISGLSKYAQLLLVIEEMSKDIRPSYTGSRIASERLKRGIVHARILVRECLLEVERSASRQ